MRDPEPIPPVDGAYPYWAPWAKNLPARGNGSHELRHSRLPILRRGGVLKLPHTCVRHKRSLQCRPDLRPDHGYWNPRPSADRVSARGAARRSEEHTSELQALMRL